MSLLGAFALGVVVGAVAITALALYLARKGG